MGKGTGGDGKERKGRGEARREEGGSSFALGRKKKVGAYAVRNR